MNKFTTEQLKAALIELRNRTDAQSVAAYEMTFDAVCERMGDEAFDLWCDGLGW